MTKADIFAIAGFACIVIGAAMIYKPLGFLAAGAALILFGRAVHIASKKTKGAE
jgi:hypothetical protein